MLSELAVRRGPRFGHGTSSREKLKGETFMREHNFTFSKIKTKQNKIKLTATVKNRRKSTECRRKNVNNIIRPTEFKLAKTISR